MSDTFTSEDFQNHTQLALIVRSVNQLVRSRNWRAIRDMVAAWETPEIADVLTGIEKNERVLLFRALPRQISADTFSYLAAEDQQALLHDLSDSESRRVLSEMDPDDRVALISELPGQVSQMLLRLLSAEDRAEVQTLLGYPEESVGRLMTPEYIDIRDTITVGEALVNIRERGSNRESLNRIYVTDKKGVLLDDLHLHTLVLSKIDEPISKLTDDNFVSLSAFDDREAAVHAMQRYDVTALPVVDSQGVLLGIVTVDDVMDVAEQEATEDMQKAASVSPLKTGYKHIGVFPLFRKRIPWLTALVLFNLVSALILTLHEKTMEQAVSLVFFLPLLLGAAGNAGSQSATIILRALVTGDIRLNEWSRSFLKEIAVGILLGLFLGVLSLCLGSVYSGLKIGLIVGLSMIAIVLVANLVGMTLPFVLEKIKLDPAVASSPLITTIADASGLFIYFSIAAWLL